MAKDLFLDDDDDATPQTLFTVEVTLPGLVEEARESGGQLRVVTPFGRMAIFNHRRVSKNKVALVCDDASTEQADYFAQIPGYKVEGREEQAKFIAPIDDHFLEAERTRSTREAQKLGIPNDMREQGKLMRELTMAIASRELGGAATINPVPLVTRQQLGLADLDAQATATLTALLEEAGVQLKEDYKPVTLYFEAARLAKVDPLFNVTLTDLIDESDYRKELAGDPVVEESAPKRGRPAKAVE